MELNKISPWAWQDNFGYSQAIEVKQSEGTLYCSGQTAMTADGQPFNGTMEEQIALSLDNLKTVIEKAGYEIKNLVRLNIYTTSIPETFAAWGTLAGWLQKHGSVPTSTLLEVKALAFPELKIEFEATVIK
ncbi:RidA family protein [Mucilaginibacter ginkgonis]|uniref:RidA family protein n=1 Tax=Mucilaginibacter ginkgonis TaxID=2682091 RepID=A0A6I4INW7_9SPHI|nr:RidA family protein [Mucilaginibacter ginkgonis]QQL50468.1 RidA family protein [Mucilaginibacter ginkgonis]